MNDRLYRSRDDRVLGGVCGGLAVRMDVDPSLVRIGWVLLTFLTGGALLVLYVIMLIVVPEEPVGGVPPAPPSPDAYPGWAGPTPPAGAAPGTSTAFAAGATPPDATPGPAASAGSTAEPGSSPGWIPPTGSAPGPAPAPGTTAWVPPDQAYAAREAERRARHARRDRSAGLVFGVLLILVGAYFLVSEYLPTIQIDRFWPVVVIAVGILFLVLSVRRNGAGEG